MTNSTKFIVVYHVLTFFGRNMFLPFEKSNPLRDLNQGFRRNQNLGRRIGIFDILCLCNVTAIFENGKWDTRFYTMTVPVRFRGHVFEMGIVCASASLMASYGDRQRDNRTWVEKVCVSTWIKQPEKYLLNRERTNLNILACHSFGTHADCRHGFITDYFFSNRSQNVSYPRLSFPRTCKARLSKCQLPTSDCNFALRNKKYPVRNPGLCNLILNSRDLHKQWVVAHEMPN